MCNIPSTLIEVRLITSRLRIIIVPFRFTMSGYEAYANERHLWDQEQMLSCRQVALLGHRCGRMDNLSEATWLTTLASKT